MKMTKNQFVSKFLLNQQKRKKEEKQKYMKKHKIITREVMHYR